MRRARGFTLIEVLVALAIFTVLMVIIFVPLTQATRFMAIGRTRAALQQSANGTMLQLQRDLSRAIYVYPNDNLPGITDQLPYSTTPGTSSPPYIQGGAPVGNTSRIDFLLPERDVNGGVKYPITPAKYIVTYYARRNNTALPYDPYTNPVVLYRAQYPYRNADDTLVPSINVSSTRYNNLGANEVDWLRQSDLKEPQALQSATEATTVGVVPNSHSLVTPSNVQLVLPLDNANALLATNGLKPNTTFNLADTNSDGKIDRVSVNLTLMNFNRQVRSDGGNDTGKAIGENPNFQRFTLSQTFNLPNIR